MYSPPPSLLVTPLVLANVCPFSPFNGGIAESSVTPASATGNATNEALYFPFVVTTPATFTRGFWYNGSAPAGNVCVGIYSEAQSRLATTGSVAAAGASVVQTAAFSASVALDPGVYYMAFELSAGAGLNQVVAYSNGLQKGKLTGLYRQAVGAFPLPATAAFATWTSQVIPIIGVATTSFAI